MGKSPLGPPSGGSAEAGSLANGDGILGGREEHLGGHKGCLLKLEDLGGKTWKKHLEVVRWLMNFQHWKGLFSCHFCESSAEMK